MKGDMSSQIAIAIITFVVTLVMSVSTSMFIAGMRWGEVKTDLSSLKSQVAKIEGMFELRLRDPK